MIRKTALAGLAVLGTGALLLSACAGGTGTPSTSSSSGSIEELPLVGYETVDYSDLVDGGTLNLSVLSSPTDEGSWNPNHALAANVEVQKLLAPTIASLYVANDDGSTTVDENYATSIELTSEDPQIATVELNPDAVFEDGSPITAADYAATYAAGGGAEAGYEVVPSSVFDAIDTVSVTGDYSFTVQFTEPYADWQSLFTTSPLPASIANDQNAFNTAYSAAPVPSVGPYVFDQIDNDAKIYSLVPNPNWWGQEPKLDSITWKVIAQESLPQAYANDELDELEIQTPDALETASAKEGAVVQRSGGVTWSHLTFNGTAAPFDDYAVRKAVALAIDRETIARVANEPLGAPATTLGDWIFMPGQEGYSDTFGEVIGNNDTDLAMTTLEDAGWTHGDGEWTKDGETLSFSITVPSGTQSNINRALGVQDSLARIDVPVELDEVPGEDYFVNIEAGDFQAVTFGWQGTLFPISSAETIYTPSDSPQNYARITNDDLEDLWAQANSELDPDARLALAKQINEAIADYLPSVPIYPYPEVVAVDGGIANFGTATFKSIDWTTVGYTEAQ